MRVCNGSIALLLLIPFLSSCGPSKEEQAEAWRKVDEAQADFQRKLDRDLLESTTRLVGIRLGEVTADTYHLCHTYPPTTEKHKAECKRVDDAVAKMEAAIKKDPW